MDEQIQKMTPNYSRIYHDLIQKKFPDYLKELQTLYSKESLSNVDVISLNQKLFEKEESLTNSRFRSYSKKDILRIFTYQKNHNLNNSQLASHYKLSRNTITKWKKLFL